MKTCNLCGAEFETVASLGAHRRVMHKGYRGPNRKAIAKLLSSLGHEPDAATRQTALSIADALDIDPMNAQMWRTYRELVRDLTEGEDAGAEEDDELAQIRGLSKVGNLKAV